MPHAYTSIVTHVIFATKDRAPILPEELDDELHAFVGGILRSLRGGLLAADGWLDHRHLLAWHPASLSVADLARHVKSRSSAWINETRRVRGRFAWQSGYSAFSVSKSNIQTVTDYIAKQKEHHRVVTFQEEWIAFLRKNDITFDSKYTWG